MKRSNIAEFAWRDIFIELAWLFAKYLIAFVTVFIFAHHVIASIIVSVLYVGIYDTLQRYFDKVKLRGIRRWLQSSMKESDDE